MTDPASRLERLLGAGRFCVTSEVVPPSSADGSSVTAQARGLVGYADAANVTDNPTSSAHMSPLAAAALVSQAGLEPIMQLTCRDRNRLALTSDLLGAWSLGARNILCLNGDPVSIGDHPEAKPVYDLTVIELAQLATSLRSEGRLLSGRKIQDPPRYFVGVADVPLAPRYDPSRLEAKLDAGAGFVQTQIVYDVDAFGEWAGGVRGRGIFERARVLAGVAPLVSAKAAKHMNEKVPGVSVPREHIRALEEAGPRAVEVGVGFAIEIVGRLQRMEGIAGVHVIGLGRDEAVRRVIEGAGLLPRTAPPPDRAGG